MGHRTAVQSLASLAGTAFLVLGILGFIPGVTSDFAQLRFAGHRSAAQLLGVFDVSILQNLLHLAYGVAGLRLARTQPQARLYFLGGGGLFLALWLFGLLVDRGDRANFLPVNGADNWLHFSLGLVMVVTGLLLGRRPAGTALPA
jgi:hypothetical protein